MASHRPVEAPSIHASSFHTGWIRASNYESPWEVVAHAANNNPLLSSQDDVIPCTYLDLATHIHMHGTAASLKQHPHLTASKGSSHYFRWNKDLHFHENLRIPVMTSDDTTTATNKGMLVMLDAMASEGVAVALSPQPGFQKGQTVEIQFGAVGNTKTTILRKHAPSQNNNNHNHQSVSVPCRVCQEGTWVSLWVSVYNGKVYVGTGSQPGQKCLAFLDLTEDNAVEENGNGTAKSTNPDNNIDDSAMDTPEAGTANNETTANGGEANAISTANKDNSRNGDNLLYVGLGNAAQQRRQIKIRHLHVTAVPTFVTQELENTTESSTMDVLMDQQDGVDDQALKDYQEQCRRAKARAQKFGIEYKEPSLAAVVPWSQAKKLSSNPQKGFITGIDVTDPEELAKQEARKSRFGVLPSKKRELEDDDANNNNNEDTIFQAKEEVTASEADAAAGDSHESMITPIQAWDNEELVRFQRVDPPASLWKNPQKEEEAADEFAMETDKPTLVPEKIHIFSNDWSAFKQIRSEDLMVHFTIYGPSYVEWLSDLGCNILFEDKYSAVRAMQAMAQDLPSPPPSELNENDDEYVPPDLGAMGWKMGRKLVRKIKNDRHGRRGTTARILMRPATSADILIERPSTWPKPPPGFSTKRVLGPGSDYAPIIDDDEPEDNYQNNDAGHRKKRRRRNSDGPTGKNNNNRTNSTNNNNNSDAGQRKNSATGKRRQRGGHSNSPQPSAADRLNQGLSSSRAGFSVDELEALRAAKKNAISK